uniref:Uncharacterized protein n=1 Tax=Arundo donax TaxID=35708 RepID=A0A0A8ZTS7_ARUDO
MGTVAQARRPARYCPEPPRCRCTSPEHRRSRRPGCGSSQHRRCGRTPSSHTR